MEFVQTLLVFSSSLAWFLVSAKTHGRQIRLEREHRGVDEVDFRRATKNHPWVEELWKRDRVAYWTTVGVALLPILGALYFLDEIDRWAVLPLTILFSMAVAFTSQAVASQLRLARALHAPSVETLGPSPRHQDAEWRIAARRGTLRWFTLDSVTFALAIIALSMGIMT